jgi:hypothetical protein
MNNAQMIAALAALPDPDLLAAAPIDAPLGSRTYYQADTVVRLLAAQQRPTEAAPTSLTPPPESADRQSRFDAFRKALNALCTRHGIQLCTSQYDSLQAWPLLPGESPVYANGFENKL